MIDPREWEGRIYVGDCLEFLRELPDGCVDAVVTDPPYGYGKYASDRRMTADTFVSLARMGRCAAIFGYPEDLIFLCVAARITPSEWVTWFPTNKQGTGWSPKLPKACECIAIFGETQDARAVRRPRARDAWARMRAEQRGLDPDTAQEGDVWRDASPGMACNAHLRLHPNEKPESLMEKLLLLCTSPGDLILDPFLGSGTTAVVSERLGRRWIGCEINPDYAAMAEKRIQRERERLRLPLEVTAP